MKPLYFDLHLHGFYGAYYKNPRPSSSAVILMLGEGVDDHLITSCVRWLQKQQLNVMALAPSQDPCGYYSFPLERFGLAISWLQDHGNVRCGILGGSATASLALLAAAYYPALTLTVAVSPCDFVMEEIRRAHV